MKYVGAGAATGPLKLASPGHRIGRSCSRFIKYPGNTFDVRVTCSSQKNKRVVKIVAMRIVASGTETVPYSQARVDYTSAWTARSSDSPAAERVPLQAEKEPQKDRLDCCLQTCEPKGCFRGSRKEALVQAVKANRGVGGLSSADITARRSQLSLCHLSRRGRNAGLFC